MTPNVPALSLLLALLIPGDEAGGQPVAGLLHHSVEFYPLDLSLPVLEVVWKFIAQEKTRKVAMYHKDQFTPYDAQFTDRLQLSNYGTKLRINDLRMEDTGVYTAEMTFTNGEMGHESYVLTVYEPIPPPKVITETENTAERCNFTLQCSVTANISDLSYSWKSRHQDSTYQPYSNGSTLQISLPPGRQDMEIMCIVQNPADQKNVSISISVKSCSDAVVAVPMVLYQPVDVMYVDVDTTTELSCESTGPLESGTGISWYRRSWKTGGNISLVKSCAVDNDQNKYVCSNSRNTATLRIHNAQTSDSGVYFCANHINSNVTGNGTTLVVGEMSTCKRSVHLLAHIQQPLPVMMAQLACVVHGVHNAVHITWNISGINSKGKVSSIQKPDGTWTFMNIISLPMEGWNHRDLVVCKVWSGSIRVLVHWKIPAEDAQKTFISDCSLYLRAVLAAIILVICMAAICISHTCI